MTRHVLPPVQCLCVSTHPPRMTKQPPAQQADAPSNAVEAAVCHLHALLSKRRRLEPGVVAEWWVHGRSCGAAHGLHFDVDETRLRRGKRAYSLRHPVRSSRLGSALVARTSHTLLVNKRFARGVRPARIARRRVLGSGLTSVPALALPSGSTARRGGQARGPAAHAGAQQRAVPVRRGGGRGLGPHARDRADAGVAARRARLGRAGRRQLPGRLPRQLPARCPARRAPRLAGPAASSGSRSRPAADARRRLVASTHRSAAWPLSCSARANISC